MNLEGPVGAFCLELWNQRKDSVLTPVGAIRAARLLALAIADEVNDSETYDPVEDRRILWAWGVLRAVVRGDKPPMAAEEHEDVMAFMLGETFPEVPAVRPLSGKELAAGGDR